MFKCLIIYEIIWKLAKMLNKILLIFLMAFSVTISVTSHMCKGENTIWGPFFVSLGGWFVFLLVFHAITEKLKKKKDFTYNSSFVWFQVFGICHWILLLRGMYTSNTGSKSELSVTSNRFPNEQFSRGREKGPWTAIVCT